ncbi:MAG: hypothetical protein ACTSRK_10715 [Promethearchaeota archaeon]
MPRFGEFDSFIIPNSITRLMSLEDVGIDSCGIHMCITDKNKRLSSAIRFEGEILVFWYWLGDYFFLGDGTFSP